MHTVFRHNVIAHLRGYSIIETLLLYALGDKKYVTCFVAIFAALGWSGTATPGDVPVYKSCPMSVGGGESIKATNSQAFNQSPKSSFRCFAWVD